MKKMAKNIMIQGTSSHVGKTILVAALCRIFKNRGFRVAPFKAQNMALNSSVTVDGGEIGRAQALQAEAAGIAPTVDLNPILLKPSNDSLSQVIIHGKVFGVMSAREYHGFKKDAMKFVLESYQRLANAYDIIVIEGAGSPAEVNLRENDIANMGVAEATSCPVLIAGDIDRGGVFASIVGTMELLTEKEKKMVKGFIINKFRGDLGLLAPGLEFLARRTGRPVIGVVPYARDIVLPDEDSVSLEGIDNGAAPAGKKIRIAVIRLPRISNFTDFDAFKCDPTVELRFIEDPDEVCNADMVIIPGTKNTIEDLVWVKEKGFEAALKKFYEVKKGTIVGICGGFQMLGRTVMDPFGVESDKDVLEGLSFLDTETTLKRNKDTFRVKAQVRGPGNTLYNVDGYEIHMGETSGGAAPFSKITGRNSGSAGIKEGGVSEDGKIWGTYIHGVFDNDFFREAIIKDLLEQKGMKDDRLKKSYKELKEASLAHISKLVEENLRMNDVLAIMGLC